jgi:hypothetical protein
MVTLDQHDDRHHQHDDSQSRYRFFFLKSSLG